MPPNESHVNPVPSAARIITSQRSELYPTRCARSGAATGSSSVAPHQLPIFSCMPACRRTDAVHPCGGSYVDRVDHDDGDMLGDIVAHCSAIPLGLGNENSQVILVSRFGTAKPSPKSSLRKSIVRSTTRGMELSSERHPFAGCAGLGNSLGNVYEKTALKDIIGMSDARARINIPQPSRWHPSAI